MHTLIALVLAACLGISSLAEAKMSGPNGPFASAARAPMAPMPRPVYTAPVAPKLYIPPPPRPINIGPAPTSWHKTFPIMPANAPPRGTARTLGSTALSGSPGIGLPTRGLTGDAVSVSNGVHSASELVGQVNRASAAPLPAKPIGKPLDAAGAHLGKNFRKLQDGVYVNKNTRSVIKLKAGDEQNVLKAGEAGAFNSLKGVKGDGLTPHHMPQAAAGRTSYNEGGALVMRHDEHAATRTYGFKGVGTVGSDAKLTFREVLSKDIRDVRSIVGAKYNKGLRSVGAYYREKFPHLMDKDSR